MCARRGLTAGGIRDGQGVRGSLGGPRPGGQRRRGGPARFGHRGPGRAGRRPGGGRRRRGRGRRQPGARPYLPRLPAVVRDDPRRAAPPGGKTQRRREEPVMGERELHHLRAARHWAEGDWEAATRSLERALLCHPRDLLALKVAQDLYFFLGNRLELRDTAARVLPAWTRDRPGWGYVQGIYAFGLEENAASRQAESRARAALEVNPRDVWSVH